MFRIIGDEIEYEYRIIGRLTVPTFDTWRNRAVELLEDMDPNRVERERDEAVNEVEQEYKDRIADLETDVQTLEDEKAKLENLLDEIEGGSTCAELLDKYRAEIADWRKIAEDNRAAYLKAVAPKPRKRRVAHAE